MTSNISITTSLEHHTEAAKVLSSTLDALGWKHAFIGGFAWALLGSMRKTEMKTKDDPQNLSILELRDQLRAFDDRFASAGFKLYFVREPNPLWKSQGDPGELVKHSQGNVLIETLRAGSLGLPANAGPTYVDPRSMLPVLHPTLLPLTKIKRWFHLSSSRPKTIAKRKTDQRDIVFMLGWLNSQSLKVQFVDYAGTDKRLLLRYMASFYHQLKEDEDLCQSMKNAMYEEDWEAMLDSEPMKSE